MKKIIKLTESDLTRIVKRVLTENDYKYQMFVEVLSDMIENFDDIDCDNPQKRYESMYCENMSDWSIEDLKKKRQFYQDKLSASIYDEFYQDQNN